jgi:hypothetical protein
MFKSEFESKEFENLKKSCKKKMFFYIDLSSGPNSSRRPSQFSFFFHACGPTEAHATDLVAQSPCWVPHRQGPTRPTYRTRVRPAFKFIP